MWLAGCSQTHSRKLKISGLRKLWNLYHWRLPWAFKGKMFWAPTLNMILYEWKKNTNAGTLKGVERPSPSSTPEVVAEQLAWGHPRKPFPHEVRCSCQYGPRWQVNSSNFYSWELLLQGHLASLGTILQVGQLSLCLVAWAFPWAFLVVLPLLFLSLTLSSRPWLIRGQHRLPCHVIQV